MQLDRLFEIIYILQERKTVSAQELAAHFEVSVKTIYRDAEKLSLAGMPIYTSRGRGGGISLMPDFVLDKAVLTQEDKLGIGSAISAFEKIDPSGMLGKASQLKAFFGGGQDWIEVDFSSWGNPDRDRRIFEMVKQAVLHRLEMEFTYRNARGESLRRRVQPLKLGFKGQAWYVYAYCLEKKAERFFKLSRIHTPKVTAVHFSREKPARIFPDEGIYGGGSIKVQLRLSAQMGYRAYDEFEEVKAQADGSFLVWAYCDDAQSLYSYLVSFGEHCEVLAPKDFKREFAGALKNIIEKYK